MMIAPKTVAAMPLTAVRADAARPEQAAGVLPRRGAAHPLDDLVLALEEAEGPVAPRELVDEAGQRRDQL